MSGTSKQEPRGLSVVRGGNQATVTASKEGWGRRAREIQTISLTSYWSLMSFCKIFSFCLTLKFSFLSVLKTTWTDNLQTTGTLDLSAFQNEWMSVAEPVCLVYTGSVCRPIKMNALNQGCRTRFSLKAERTQHHCVILFFLVFGIVMQ